MCVVKMRSLSLTPHASQSVIITPPTKYTESPASKHKRNELARKYNANNNNNDIHSLIDATDDDNDDDAPSYCNTIAV